MAYVTLKSANTSIGIVRVRVNRIEVDGQVNATATNILGVYGSEVSGERSGGRLITLSISAKDDEIRKIDWMRNTTMLITLSSFSKAKYNGKYRLLSLGWVEDKAPIRGLFDVDMTLQEYTRFNVTRQKFVNYNIKINNPAQINVGTKFNPQTK